MEMAAGDKNEEDTDFNLLMEMELMEGRTRRYEAVNVAAAKRLWRTRCRATMEKKGNEPVNGAEG